MLQHFYSGLVCPMTKEHSAEMWIGAKSSLSGLYCGPSPTMSASLGWHVTRGCNLLWPFIGAIHLQ